MSGNRTLRLVFSLALIPSGAVLVLIAGTGRAGQLVGSLGLSLIVTGILNAFREVALLRLEAEETAEETARRVQAKVAELMPERSSGIRLVSPVRRGYERFYSWAVDTHPQELFFAGRSVLHRIDADFATRGLPPVEQVLLRKLREGSTIRILFLDPRSDLIRRLAKEEGQRPRLMRADLATSLGVCRRLYGLLEGVDLPARAQLHVRVYDEVPYFSYHREDESVIVGFYFTAALGSQSAAFAVADPQTRAFFEGHFTSIFDRAAASAVLEVVSSRGAAEFHAPLYAQMRAALADKLGEERVAQAMGPAG